MKQMFREIQDFYLGKVKFGHQSRGCREASKLEKKKKKKQIPKFQSFIQ